MDEAGSREVTFKPVTRENWRDLAALFGPKGACAGCWCMWWRVSASKFRTIKGEGARRALKRLVDAGTMPGILAFDGIRPVGWCAVAPRREYVRLSSSSILAPVDEKPVWSIVCFFVARQARRQGLSGKLIKAAVAHARDRGAQIIEAYPVDASANASPKVSPLFLYTGVASAFRAQGFVEVARRSASRPVMRKRIKATTAGKRL